MFSLENYRTLLSALKDRGYCVIPLSHFKGDKETPTILLRFDVDYYPPMALQIAQVNAEAGIAGTFFFLMDSPLYNLISYSVRQIIRTLLTLKQEIGWHVSCNPEGIEADSLITKWDLFRQIIPEARPLIAWHNPKKDLLDQAEATVKSIGILQSVYGEPFISRDVKYFSDSNRRNGFRDLMNNLHVEPVPRAQLLLHPLNWVVGGDTMEEILNRVWKAVLKEIDKEFAVNPIWRRKRCASQGR